jgi:alanine dehydrogenase
VLAIANRGIVPAAQTMAPIAAAVNIMDGEVTNRAVAETFGLPHARRFG